MNRILIFLVLITTQVGYATCQDDVVDLFSRRSKIESVNSVAMAQQALRRNLSANEAAALKESLKQGRKDIYTANDVAAQDRILKKAKYSEEEIATLRRENVLTNSVVRINGELPREIKVLDLKTHRLAEKDVEHLQQEKNLWYIKDAHGDVHISEVRPDVVDDAIHIIKSGAGVDSGAAKANNIVASEIGQLSYSKKTKQFQFNPSYGIGIPPRSSQELAAQFGKLGGKDAQVVQLTNKKIPQTKAYDCLDILSAQTAGKNMILNRLISDNVVTIGGIGIGEALGNGRTKTQEGREIIAADLIGTNINVFVSGYIGSKLVLNNADFIAAVGTRAAVGMGMIEIQKNVYENTLSSKPQERAEKIAQFDQAYSAGKLVWNQAFEKALVGGWGQKFNIPNMIFNACQSNSKMKVLINPLSIRFMERGAFAGIYYGTRMAVVNE